MPVSVTGSSLGGASGKAAARDSRSATSFLEGRLRFFGRALDFPIREMSAECLIIRLSFLVVLKTFCLSGFEEVELLLEARARRAERLPLVGAYKS